MPAATEKHLFANLEGIAAHAVEIRHDLHRHPELGYQENYTANFICKELERLGIEYNRGIAGTGVVGLIRGSTGTEAGGGGNSGHCVALRADMDALPVAEETAAPYASQRQGLMHACGHDGHMAILLGAAAILQENRERLAETRSGGTIKLIFQPAEEGGCGALKMCEAGVLDNPKVDAIFGLHGWPGLKVGTVATRPGVLLASVNGFTIRVHGRGGHAAAPQNSVDPIVCAAAIVQSLQTIVSREADPSDASVLTISQISSGTAFNVIPDKAELHGTIRALSKTRREATIGSLERIARGIAAAHRCEADFHYFGTTPCTVNHAGMAAFVKETAQRVLGGKTDSPSGGTRAATGSGTGGGATGTAGVGYVDVPQPAMWGEDFAFYLERVPGCFFVLGVQPQDRASYPMLHNPRYDFTDAAVPVGIRMMVELALGYLERGESGAA